MNKMKRELYSRKLLDIYVRSYTTDEVNQENYEKRVEKLKEESQEHELGDRKKDEQDTVDTQEDSKHPYHNEDAKKSQDRLEDSKYVAEMKESARLDALTTIERQKAKVITVKPSLALTGSNFQIMDVIKKEKLRTNVMLSGSLENTQADKLSQMNAKEELKKETNVLYSVYPTVLNNSPTTSRHPTNHLPSPSLLATNSFRKGLCSDWWSDVEIKRETHSVKWHPLFPDRPQHTSIAKSLTDRDIVSKAYVKRLYGFLFTNQTAMFEFKLSSRDGLEFMLVDTGMMFQNFTTDYNVSMGTPVLYSYFNVTEMKRQDKIIPDNALFSLDKRVKLHTNRIYFVEVLQGGLAYGKMDIKWRTGNESFEEIDQRNLLQAKCNKIQNRNGSISLLSKINKPHIKYPPKQNEINRMKFHEIPILNTENIYKNSTIICEPVTRKHVKIVYEYYGKDYLDRQIVFPKEYFNYTGGWPTKHLLLNETEAVLIAEELVKEIQHQMNRSFKIQNIVHIQKNLNQQFISYPQWKQTHYFVELDVLSVDDQKIYRTTHFVRHDKTQNRICFIKEYQWKPNVTVNILTPVKNQAVWIHHLLKSLETIITKTNEKNIRLILIDYNSTDANIRDILASYNVPFKLVKVGGSLFNKVKSLNIALSHVTNDEIAFVLDLHLELPLNLFDRMRKQTFQGLAGFSPTLLKFFPGQHEQYTEFNQSPPLWVDDGFGMMALYKSDWNVIGGMNEEKFGTSWGGEDWECVDRLVKNGYYLFHNRLPRFYHIFHYNHATWDGKHI